MPIEIRELVIRAQIDPDNHPSTVNSASAVVSRERNEEIIRVCVQEVLRILEDKRER